jgi:hypothetical protein
MRLCCPDCAKKTGELSDLQRYTMKDEWHCPKCDYTVTRVELLEAGVR